VWSRDDPVVKFSHFTYLFFSQKSIDISASGFIKVLKCSKFTKGQFCFRNAPLYHPWLFPSALLDFFTHVFQQKKLFFNIALYANYLKLKNLGLELYLGVWAGGPRLQGARTASRHRGAAPLLNFTCRLKRHEYGILLRASHYFFILFWLDDGRIRIRKAKKLTDPDPVYSLYPDIETD
jgi:hypothetical protein